jgi:hypothetical protein
MGKSPYRRGVPVLFVGAGVLAVAGVGIGWGSSVSARNRTLPVETQQAQAPAPASAPAEEATPSRREREVPVETTPPGARVYDVTSGRVELLCTATPCSIAAGKTRDMVVSLELPGYASAQAHVDDVLAEPGGTLMLTFQKRGTSSLAAVPRELHFPTVRQGSVQVSSGLPPEVVQRIARQNFGRFRLCYENGLRNNPNLQGRVVARLTIEASGEVADAVDGGSDLPDASVVACIVRGFKGLMFPQPEGGRRVTVVYPLVFNPGS